MKKNYLSIIAATMLLAGATSCSQEDSLMQGADKMTTFKISLEGASQSRTAGDGMTVDNLYYEVYQGETKILDNHGPDANADPVSITKGVTSVDMPLLRGEKYKIMFWAQNTNSIYTATDLKQISIDYTNANANKEAYDAFYFGDTDFQATNNVTTIELKRPFGQLNIGTTLQDWADAKAVISGTDAPVTASQIKVKGLAKKFNVLTGRASEDAGEVTFQMSAIDDLGTFEVKKDGNKKEYQYLSMNYLLVPTSNEDVHKSNVNMTATFRRGTLDLFDITLPNVTIERNWRTNILGDLLAADKTFEIIIDAEFGGSYNYPSTSEEQLYMAAAIGGEVTLTEDVILDEPLVAVTDMVINLNGHSISGGKEYVTGMTGTDISAIVIDKGANMILNGSNGTVKGSEYGVYVKNGSLTIKDGNYEGGTSAVQINQGTANIEGGHFSVSGTDKRYVINCIDKNWDEGKAKVNITGGTFKEFNPFDNVAEGSGTNFVAEGYQVTLSANGYIVSLSDGPDYIDKGDYYEVYKATGLLKWAYVANNMDNTLGLKVMCDIEMPARTIEADAINATYKFTETDITVDGNGIPSGSNWIPVRNNADAKGANYTGVIEGNNNTIKGLIINYDKVTAGFVGYMEGGKIQNLKLSEANVYSTQAYAGAFVGYNEDNSTIENCHLLQSKVVGKLMVGGIVGCNWTKDNLKSSAVIKSCTTDQASIIKGHGTTSGNGGSLRGVGGIAGQNWGGNILNCTNNATINGISYIGGIVGSTKPSDPTQGNSNGYIIGCVNTGNVAASSGHAGGIAGENMTSNSLKSYIVGCSSSASSIAGNTKGLLVGNNSKCFVYASWAKAINAVPLFGYSVPELYTEVYAWESVTDITDVAISAMNAQIDHYNTLGGIEQCPYSWSMPNGNWPEVK